MESRLASCADTMVSRNRDFAGRRLMAGTVRALQVEDTLCLTGGSDGDVRLWDMRIVEDYEDRLQKVNQRDADRNVLEKIADNRSVSENSDDWDEGPSGYTDASMLTTASQVEDSGPCVRVLGGHSKAISALSYEDGTLVCFPHPSQFMPLIDR